ncbi:MAG: EAL domain-containing protein [Leclercia sp.]
MQTAHRIMTNYRRKRIIVCVALALSSLLCSVIIGFISQRNLNQQATVAFVTHAVDTLDKILLPLETGRDQVQPLIGLPCVEVNFLLRKQAAALQTVRSIGLIKDGILYCSSMFGIRDIPVSQLQPQLPSAQPLLLLTSDQGIRKGNPVLIQWYPAPGKSDDGVIEIVNIDLIARMLLEPQLPFISDVNLSVGGKHLNFSREITDALAFNHDQDVYQQHSINFPFTITVNGPGPTDLALKNLPAQLPLALIFSMLVGYIAWLATANRMSFTWEINLGLAAGEFELFCQPLIDAKNQQCMGVEILLRWNNPRQGWIAPDIFIPLAEKHNLIVPLTRYVLIETVSQLAMFPAAPGFHIGINVAASHFRDGVLLHDLNRVWFSAEPSQQLVIELTERDTLLEVDYHSVDELHQRGVKLAIDDFGTGNSSLSWLEKLNPEVLKIDKSFTAAIGTDAVNSAVTDIIIALAQRLNIELVAEGVETDDQASHLRLHGVEILQGFLYARPMPLRNFPQWLAENSPPPAPHNNTIVPLMP